MRVRAFLRVQDGCSFRCAFCVIPQVRGATRSRPLGEVVAEAERRVAAGHRELVLTGVNLGLYRDRAAGVRLPGLAGAPGRARGPGAAAAVVDRGRPRRRRPRAALARTPALLPHLHVPLQSGSDAVLRPDAPPLRPRALPGPRGAGPGGARRPAGHRRRHRGLPRRERRRLRGHARRGASARASRGCTRSRTRRARARHGGHRRRARRPSSGTARRPCARWRTARAASGALPASGSATGCSSSGARRRGALLRLRPRLHAMALRPRARRPATSSTSWRSPRAPAASRGGSHDRTGQADLREARLARDSGAGAGARDGAGCAAGRREGRRRLARRRRRRGRAAPGAQAPRRGGGELPRGAGARRTPCARRPRARSSTATCRRRSSPAELDRHGGRGRGRVGRDARRARWAPS